MEEKKNLTLSINKEVLEKARELGLNLSALTESILKTASLTEEKLVKTDDLRKIYRKIFQEIASIMQEWSQTYFLRIGGKVVEEEFKDQKGKLFLNDIYHVYYLDPNGKIEHYIEEPFEQTIKIWNLKDEDWPIQYFYKSEKIISRLIEMLYKRAKQNKEQMEDLKILENVLKKLRAKEEKKSENGK